MSDTQLEELGVIRIATPCAVPWASMSGDDTVRHCGHCKLNVYNVENLTSFAVRELLIQREGRVCMRIFKRSDGTLLTKDCPRGLAAVPQVWRQSLSRVSSMNPGVLSFVAMLSVVFVAGIVSLFGDNIRRLEAMSGDSLASGEPMTAAQRRQIAEDPRAAVLARFHAAPPCPTRRAP